MLAAETESTEMTPYRHAKITCMLFVAIPTFFRRDDQFFVWATTEMWSMGALGTSLISFLFTVISYCPFRLSKCPFPSDIRR